MNPASLQPYLDQGYREHNRKEYPGNGRGLAHALKPVVLLGQHGLSDAALAEIGLALEHHELIKVRMNAPEDKKTAAVELAARAEAELCGVIGHTVILFRRNETSPKVAVPR